MLGWGQRGKADSQISASSSTTASCTSDLTGASSEAGKFGAPRRRFLRRRGFCSARLFEKRLGDAGDLSDGRVVHRLDNDFRHGRVVGVLVACSSACRRYIAKK